MNSISAALVAGGFLLLSCFPENSYAQLHSRRGSAGTYASRVNIGATGVQQGSVYARDSYLRGVRGGGAAAGNYVTGGRAAPSFGGRRASQRVAALGTALLNAPRRTGMLTYFGNSPSAQWIGLRPYTGQGAVQFPQRPTFAYGTRQIVGAPLNLLYNRSYHYRAALPLEGSRIRDELTNRSLENIPPVPEDLTSAEHPQQTHAQILTTKLEASRSRYRAQGWAWLKEGDYVRSRGAFGSASLLEQDALAPRVGKLLCDVANRQFSTAGVDLTNIVAHHADDMFDVHYPLQEVLGSKELAEAVLARCATLARRMPDSPESGAINAYALWLDGQRSRALAAAQKLRTDFRDSPFASLVEKMREQTALDEAVEEASTTSTG